MTPDWAYRLFWIRFGLSALLVLITGAWLVILMVRIAWIDPILRALESLKK